MKVMNLAIAHGVEDGIEWATRPAPLYGAINGYVRLPEGHPWRMLADIQFTDQPDVDVNGGITYGVDKDGWIGFDTLHAGDYWPGMRDTPGYYDTRWTPDMVAEEARKLARQVAEAMVE